MALQDFTNALAHTEEININVTGRKSGRSISHPIWFVRDGQRLYLLPVRGSEGDWYKNVVKTPNIRLMANGSEYEAKASTITDSRKVNEVVSKFREKYGSQAVSTYYSKLDAAVEVPLAS